MANLRSSPLKGLPEGPKYVRGLTIACGAWLFAVGVWSLTIPPFEFAWQNAIDHALLIPIRAVIAALAFKLSMKKGISDQEALAWRLFGSAFALSILADFLRVLSTYDTGAPVPLRMMFVVPQGVMTIAALWLIVRIRRDQGRAADWFDAGILVVSGFILTSYFAARGSPFNASHLGAARWLFLCYLAIDLAAVLLAATAWFRRPTGFSRQVLGYIGLGYTVVTVADLLFDQAIQHGTWQDGGVIDFTLAAGFTLIALALNFHRATAAGGAMHIRSGMRRGRHVVAPIAILTASLPLLYHAWLDSANPDQLRFLVTASTILLVLVMARQFIALRMGEEYAAAREAADARFRSLVQRSSDAIFQIAKDQTIQWASPSAGQLTGTIPSLLAGRKIAELAHPEDRDRLAVFLANAGETFARNAVLHWRLGRDDAWHEVESVVTDLTGDAAVGALVLNTRNVSERVRLELQLRQGQKLEAVGRLSGGIAHDFNNILAAIITHAQLVRDQMPPNDERAADLIEIEQTAQRGAVLTRRLLSFSRPDAGEIRVQPLRDIVRGMEPMLRRLLIGQVQLSMDVTDDDLWIRAAEGQMEQILMNLAINARDAMPEGGVVHLSTREFVIEPGDKSAIRGILPGRWAELTVRDGGVGMDAETLDRLFEPFFTTKPTGLGTGLGLATVRGIVRALGGHVTAESAVDKGTTMRVILPIAPREQVEALTDPVSLPSAGVNLRPVIMVVDDEVALQRAMERFLKRSNYEVIAVGSAIEALEILKERNWQVDLVVTDMVMPRMGGREFIRHIKESAPDMPVLCISGHVAWEEGDENDPNAPWAPDNLLAKPFPFPEFLVRVKTELKPLFKLNK